MSQIWQGAGGQNSIKYTCSFCGNPIASNIGYITKDQIYNIRICHFCSKPTFFPNPGTPVPGSPMGNPVGNIGDKDLNALYEEARKCATVNAHTAAVLACRKILMHIAVDKKAEQGKKFIEYIEYLADNNYIPPDAKVWVDHIRKKANEANHESVVMSKEDAKDLITFIEMLLKIIYEFPAKIPSPGQ